MGAELYSNVGELNWSMSCWLISFWSDERFGKPASSRPLDDLGTFEFSEASVQDMHSRIPLEYDVSFVDAWSKANKSENEIREAYEAAREFLTLAAESRSSLNGSY